MKKKINKSTLFLSLFIILGFISLFYLTQTSEIKKEQIINTGLFGASVYKITNNNGMIEYKLNRGMSIGSITGFGQTEYRVPVGSTITVGYTINTWNGVQWNWADLDMYQYNYKIVDEDNGRVIKYGAPWRLIHSVSGSISVVMDKEGTFNYGLEETVDYLQQGFTAKGNVKIFKVIVGSGISPTPISIPISTPVYTIFPTPISTSIITIEQPTVTQTPIVLDAPIPKTTFNPYIPLTDSTPYIITPTPTSTPRPSAYTVIPTPSPSPSTTPIPIVSPTPVTTPEEIIVPLKTVIPIETPKAPGFDIVFGLIGLLSAIYIRIKRKRM